MEKRGKMLEIERIAKKYDHWDENKQPYALLIWSIEGDRKSQFNTQRFVGGESFRENIKVLMTSCNPDAIEIEEFSGVKGKLLNKLPLRIEMREQQSAITQPQPPQMLYVPQPQVDNTQNFDQVMAAMNGLEGLEGFDQVKNGLGAVVAFERNLSQKKLEMQEMKFTQQFQLMEMNSQMIRLQDKLEAAERDNKNLTMQNDQYESRIEDLEDEIEDLTGQVKKLSPMNVIQGIGSSVLMQLVEKSPKLQGMLGLGDAPADVPAAAAPKAHDFVGIDDSKLTDAQREIKRTVNDIANAVATWPVRHIRHLIKAVTFMEDNEQHQVELVNFIDESLVNEINGNKEE